MPGATVHKLIRNLTRRYPWRTPSNELNNLLGRLGFNDEEPLWLSAEPYGECPPMELNVATDFQRKVYYFPRAYARFWLDAPFAELLRTALGPGDVFVDIGANIGYYTLLAASLVGHGGRVYAFEPEPITFQSLQRNVALDAAREVVTLVNLALSNQAGEFDFYRTYGTAHSLIGETEGDNRYRSTTRVEVARLDDWVARGHLDRSRIGLIKIDVEGEEPRTLEGMLETLRRGGLPPIWCEVRGPNGSNRAPDTFAACLGVLRPLGYRAYLWSGAGRRAVTAAEVSGQADVLFAAG